METKIVTYKDMVSRIRSSFKLVSSDNIISDRAILAEIQSTNIEQCVRQLQGRKGWNSPNLFTILPCISMEKVPLYTCCDTTSDCEIAKSEEQLPQIVDCNYNLVVQGVWSIDRKNRFKEVGTADRYSNYLKLYQNPKEKFFWIEDNYLYVTDPHIEKVAISAFFREPVDINHYSCSGETTSCPTNPLDLEFKTLPKISDTIIQIVSDKLLKTYKRSVPDHTENDKDESQ